MDNQPIDLESDFAKQVLRAQGRRANAARNKKLSPQRRSEIAAIASAAAKKKREANAA